MFAKILLKVEVYHRDLNGEFARYDHYKLIDTLERKRLASRFPNDVSKAPAFNAFFTYLEGLHVDTRIFPFGINVKRDSSVKTHEGFFVGKDSLSFSPLFLRHGDSEDVGLAIGDYGYQTIIMGNSVKYTQDKLNTEQIQLDKGRSEGELINSDKEQRFLFREMVSFSLAQNRVEIANLRVNYPHTAHLVDTFLSGGYFRKTA